MSKSRLSMRREIEAAEASGVAETKKKTRKKASATKDEGTGTAKKKRVTKPRTRRAKEAAQRRRIVWVVYSSTMREEGRFLFFERDKAEERLQQLLAKGKRRYFIQPIKEVLNPDGTPVVQVATSAIDDDMDDEVAAASPEAAEDDVEIDADLDLDVDADADDADSGDDVEEEPADS
ncbi:MAG: hypothetical protein KDA91_14100 [Planctomycetaceae bacterium]|nr:hypothetical protein [Planctomycetaceae bacterium]